MSVTRSQSVRHLKSMPADRVYLSSDDRPRRDLLNVAIEVRSVICVERVEGRFRVCERILSARPVKKPR